MNNNKTILSSVFIIILLGLASYFFFVKNKDVAPDDTPIVQEETVVYNNTEYGFTYTLPKTWVGYTVVKNTWEGTPTTSKESGPKLLIRNPKWTSALPYEDIPVLIFTTAQWESYIEEGFAVSAAPFLASELGRNNTYVFALPPRWNYDYSEGYEEAEDIVESKPLKAYNISMNSGL